MEQVTPQAPPPPPPPPGLGLTLTMPQSYPLPPLRVGKPLTWSDDEDHLRESLETCDYILVSPDQDQYSWSYRVHWQVTNRSGCGSQFEAQLHWNKDTPEDPSLIPAILYPHVRISRLIKLYEGHEFPSSIYRRLPFVEATIIEHQRAEKAASMEVCGPDSQRYISSS
jgi:hypothetical protein